MFEVTLLFLAMLLIAVCAFLPLGSSTSLSTQSLQQSDAPGDSGSNLRTGNPRGFGAQAAFSDSSAR